MRACPRLPGHGSDTVVRIGVLCGVGPVGMYKEREEGEIDLGRLGQQNERHLATQDRKARRSRHRESTTGTETKAQV